MGKGVAGGGAVNAEFGVTACLQCMLLCVNMLQLLVKAFSSPVKGHYRVIWHIETTFWTQPACF